MILYILPLVLLTCGCNMGQKILSGPRVDQPLNPIVLSIINLIATLALYAWFIRGFWIAWWLPLVGIVGSGFVAGLVNGFFRIRYPLAAVQASMLISMLGIGALIGAMS